MSINPALMHTIARPAVAPEPTFEGKTSAEWLAEAKESRQRSAASWERSDTDGFLSQAAADAMAREYDAKARIAADGGTAEFRGIFDLNGKLVALHTREGQYGDYFLNQGPMGNTAPRFIRPSEAKKGARRLATDEKKGFRVGIIRTVPEVIFVGKYTWGVAVIIPSNTKLSDVEIVDIGTGGRWYQDR